MIYAQCKNPLLCLVRGAVLVALLLCVGSRNVQAYVYAWGSLISAKYVAEEPFTDDQVKAIRHGSTTKQDILAWFGPPLAIARPGSVIKVPRPVLHQTGADDVPSGVLFQRFGPDRAVPANRIIYYYHCLIASQTLIDSLVPMSFDVTAGINTVSPDLVVRATMLWILIDQETGIVLDHRLEQVEGRESDGRFVPSRPGDKGGPAEEDGAVPWQK